MKEQLFKEYYELHQELLELNNKLDITRNKMLKSETELDLFNLEQEINNIAIQIHKKINELEILRIKEKQI